jgi:hypothetical protein
MEIKNAENFHRQLLTMLRTLREIQQLELAVSGSQLTIGAADSKRKDQAQRSPRSGAVAARRNNKDENKTETSGRQRKSVSYKL